METEFCPLCGSAHIGTDFTRPPGVTYLCCNQCDLIFLEPRFHLDLPSEKAQYDLHENDVHDERYQNFMDPLIKKLLENSPGPRGLDFGSGSTSVLQHLLAPQGFEISLYDKFYFSDTQTLERSYDFLFASEVVEHLAKPLDEFELFQRLLKPGGILVIGTSLHDDVLDLARWSYAMDPTHISFFSKKTFRWLASHLGFTEPEFFSRRGILLKSFSPK